MPAQPMNHPSPRCCGSNVSDMTMHPTSAIHSETTLPIAQPLASVAGDPAVRDAVVKSSTTAAPRAADFVDIVEEWGQQSFPASDPPANW